MTEEHAKNYLYRICGCRPDYLFAEKVVEIIKNLGSTIEEKEKQIEKMKCCPNCRYCIKEWGEVNPNGRHCKKCNKQSEWKLRS